MAKDFELPALFGDGGGGKGGSSPKESANTLQSNHILRLVEVLGEGPIHSVEQLYLNETPYNETDLSDTNAESNFSGMSVFVRLGLPDQPPVSGFTSQEAETIIDAQVEQAVPVIRTITDPDTDSARVVVKIPALFKYEDDGDMKGYSVEYTIEYRPTGGDWITIPDAPFRLEGEKNTAPVYLAHRFDLTGAAPWDIRVTRVSGDNEDDSKKQSATYFFSLSQIIDQKFSYRNTAYIGLEGNAQEFGDRIPTRAALVKGLICEVPVNFDPDTRTYSGTWNGTFKEAWTDCPAWCLRDLITKGRYGLGDYVPKASISDVALYQISQYCAGLVDDGDGGTEHRFTFNAVIQSRVDAYDLVNAMTSAFRGMAYWSAGTVLFTQDSPTDPILNVTRANTVAGEFNYFGTSIKAVHNRINVTWNDPDNFYKRDIVTVDDPDHIIKHGLRPKDVVAFGCTSKAQAIRAGRWIMFTERMESDVLTYVAGKDHADVVPGNVVRVMDPSKEGVQNGGRVASVVSGATTIQLDRSVNLAVGKTYELCVTSAERTLAYRQVTTASNGQDTDTLALDQALPTMPDSAAESVWTLNELNDDGVLYRVLSRKEVGPDQYEITAVMYDPSKYASVEGGYELPEFPTPLLPTGPLPAPANPWVMEQNTATSGTSLAPGAQISYTRGTDPRIRGVVLAYRRRDQDWQVVDMRLNMTHTLEGLVAGQKYQFRMQSYDGLGAVSPWTDTLTLRMSGEPVQPFTDGVTSFAMAAGIRNISLAWVNPTTPAYKETEVWSGTDNDPQNATLLAAVNGGGYTHGGLNTGQQVHYFTRVVYHGSTALYSDLVYHGSATTQEVQTNDIADDAVTLDTIASDVQQAIDDAAQSASADAAAAAASATAAQAAQSAAETAQTNAQTAQGIAETARDDAQTARTQAQSAQTAAETARTAAQTAEANATTQATAAGTSASAAAVSAGNASASEAAAATSETNASQSAVAAATSETVAVGLVRDSVPSTFEEDGKFWTPNLHMTPDASPDIVASSKYAFVDVSGEGRVLQMTTDGATNAGAATKGTLRLQAGRVYRTRVRARMTAGDNSPANSGLTIQSRNLASDHGSTIATLSASQEFTTLGQWYEFETVHTMPSDLAGRTWLRPFVYAPGAVDPANNVYQIAWIQVEDITESTEAETSATAAATSEANAAASETAAGTSATAAQTSETNAATSASNASTSETNASNSATNAAGSASSASSSATTAANSATAAGSSETAAASSASAAASSASTAATHATNAGDSASAASTSETGAATSASNAATSETNAATSETNASNSASAAASSATAAAASETAAGSSATSAASSASTATTQATNASQSAAAAQTAQTAAETAEAGAAVSETAAVGSATAASGHAASAESAKDVAVHTSGSFATRNIVINGSAQFGDEYVTPAGDTTATALTGLSEASVPFSTYFKGEHTGTPTDTMGNVEINFPEPVQGDFNGRTLTMSVYARTSSDAVAVQFGIVGTNKDGSFNFTNKYIAPQAGNSTWQQHTHTFTVSSDLVSISQMWFRVYSRNGVTDWIEITGMSIRDITEQEAAAGSATAAASSATAASASETAAGVSAAAASASEVSAGASATSASASQTSAASYASDAQGHSAAAQSHSEAAARTLGGAMARNPAFSEWAGTYPDNWIVQLGAEGATAAKNTADAKYTNCLHLATAGSPTTAYPRVILRGQGYGNEDIRPQDAGKILVTMEVELVSGTLADAYIQTVWDGSTAYVGHKRFGAEGVLDRVGQIQRLEFIMERESSFVEGNSADYLDVRFFVTGYGGSYSTATVRLHSFDVQNIEQNAVAGITQEVLLTQQGWSSSLLALSATANGANGEIRVYALDDLESPLSGISFSADYYTFTGGMAIFENSIIQSSNYAESGGVPTAGFQLDGAAGTIKGKSVIGGELIQNGATEARLDVQKATTTDVQTTYVYMLENDLPSTFVSAATHMVVGEVTFRYRNDTTDDTRLMWRLLALTGPDEDFATGDWQIVDTAYTYHGGSDPIRVERVLFVEDTFDFSSATKIAVRVHCFTNVDYPGNNSELEYAFLELRQTKKG